jgi:hypothetical protein
MPMGIKKLNFSIQTPPQFKPPLMLYRIFLAVLAITAWFALAAQLYIIIRYRNNSVAATVVQYFSYYTILTNLMIAWVTTSLFIRREDTSKKQKMLTAILVYIMTVGLTYNVILRSLWKPEGLQLLADNLLHTVIPVLYLVFWIAFVRKQSLQWKDIFSWLIYPLVYLIYILIRGAYYGVYPYPFIDAAQLGYAKVTVNALAVTAVILIFSLLFVGIARLFRKA